MNKVIIVKKDKIRRFMKAKKKEIQCQEKLNKREEISRAIKMQQNIIKLNNFCKKKLGKPQTVHKLPKKRNTTIQKPDEPPP